MQFRIVDKNRKYYRSISYLDNITKDKFKELFDVYPTLWYLVGDEYNSLFDKPKMVLIYYINSVKNKEIKQSNLKKDKNCK